MILTGESGKRTRKLFYTRLMGVVNNCHTNEQAKCTCSKRSTAGDIDLATQAIHFTDPMLPVLSKSRVDSLRVIKGCADVKEM